MEMLKSIIGFRETIMPYTDVSEAVFMRARELGFKYVSL